MDRSPAMAETRQHRLQKLRAKQRAAVLVVGGGINGISTYRELALQGIDVLLVDRADFMSGASAAPSRMIHGGLRYMENGEFELVRESLRERNRLLRNAPHYVSPLPTLIPIADRFSGIVSAARRFFGGKARPGARGALIVKIGLTLYDAFSGRSAPLPRHRFFGRRRTRALWPALNSRIVGSALYYDAKISYPERLGVEMILDAERDAPNALAVNHVGFHGMERGSAVLIDALTGERFVIRPDVIVNACGAWVDLTNALVDPASAKLIGGTKGSHLVLKNPALLEALGDRMVYFANGDGRVCILFAHLGNVLAGSTDISVETPDGIRCEPQERDYILQSVREVFPGIRVSEADILFRFAGVRPLPRSNAGVTAEISRDHRCEWLEGHDGPAILNLVGGKWTTFRAFGAEAADMVLARMGARRAVATEDLRIGGGRAFPSGERERSEWVALQSSRTSLSESRIAQLLSRYGTRAEDAGDFIGKSDDRPLRSLPAYSRREIEWLVRREHVATLADLVLRRTAVAFTGELSLAALHELADVAGDVLDWDEGRAREQVEGLLSQLETFHGLSPAALSTRDHHGKEPHVPEQESAIEPVVRQRGVS